MKVAIIPARGGSKRIPGKNIKLFAGKPMITHSIQAALACGLFDKVVVSTDSEEIASISRKSGAEVPFLRPAELSDDRTPTAPVLIHALNWLNENGTSPVYACCIYATAPFIQSQFLQQGYDILISKGSSSVFSVTSFGFPIFRALHITETGTLGMFWPEHELTRSQDLPEAYHDAGQFYWFECRKFLSTGRLYGADARPVLLPRYFVQDIDTLEDWQRAEHMYAALQLAGKIPG